MAETQWEREMAEGLYDLLVWGLAVLLSNIVIGIAVGLVLALATPLHPFLAGCVGAGASVACQFTIARYPATLLYNLMTWRPR